MMKKLIFILGLFGTTAARAAETCDAGRYLNGDTCTPCPAGTYKDTTGPQECTPCPPADETTRRVIITDEYYPYDSVIGTYDKTIQPTFVNMVLESWATGIKQIDGCIISMNFRNAAGPLRVEYLYYNPSTGKYDKTDGTVSYASVNAGYYLDTRYWDTYCDVSGRSRRYQKAIICPPGYYCPGGSSGTCADGPYETEWGRIECPVGHYCPAGASAPTLCPAGTYRAATGGASVDDCTACPAGTSTHTGAATSVSDCRPLCTGGITKLHAGQYVFTVWKDKQTSPSVNIRVSTGNVCYVNLVPGAGNLNFRVGDTVYHAVD